MKKYGFLDAYPLMVQRNGKGKLIILDGHHRFMAAQRVGISVKYVETHLNIYVPDIWQTDRPTSMADWLISYSREGREAYLVVQDYYRLTGIPLTCCISMLAGDSAGSGNHGIKFKSGNYKLGDPAHASIVADIVLHLKKIGVSWAANQYLVAAISKIARVEIFDPSILKNKMSSHRQLLQKQPSKQDYAEMLDDVYNRQSRIKIPLSFLADEAAKKRNVIKS